MRELELSGPEEAELKGLHGAKSASTDGQTRQTPLRGELPEAAVGEGANLYQDPRRPHLAASNIDIFFRMVVGWRPTPASVLISPSR
jgi:hypothetical protein